jgi:hypothetical protein
MNNTYDNSTRTGLESAPPVLLIVEDGRIGREMHNSTDALLADTDRKLLWWVQAPAKIVIDVVYASELELRETEG